MDDARQGHLVPQLRPGDLHSCSAEANALGRVANTQERHTLAGDMASLAEVLQAVALAVELRHDPQARGAAVHGIQLLVVWECCFHLICCPS